MATQYEHQTVKMLISILNMEFLHIQHQFYQIASLPELFHIVRADVTLNHLKAPGLYALISCLNKFDLYTDFCNCKYNVCFH